MSLRLISDSKLRIVISHWEVGRKSFRKPRCISENFLVETIPDSPHSGPSPSDKTQPQVYREMRCLSLFERSIRVWSWEKMYSSVSSHSIWILRASDQRAQLADYNGTIKSQIRPFHHRQRYNSEIQSLHTVSSSPHPLSTLSLQVIHWRPLSLIVLIPARALYTIYYRPLTNI